MAVALALDAASHIYVTGYSDLNDYLREYVTIKYTASGQGVWTNRFRGSGGSKPVALAISQGGDLCVTGGSSLTEEDGFEDDDDYEDYTTIKYNSQGNTLWTNRYRPENTARIGGATGLALDPEGEIATSFPKPPDVPYGLGNRE